MTGKRLYGERTAGREGLFPFHPQDDLEHSGLGMYISRVYCEKHGGRLAVGNAETGGAVVKAVFYAAGDGFPEHT